MTKKEGVLISFKLKCPYCYREKSYAPEDVYFYGWSAEGECYSDSGIEIQNIKCPCGKSFSLSL